MTERIGVLVPNPRQIQYASGFYSIIGDGSISTPSKVSHDLLGVVERAQRIIQEFTGCKLPIRYGSLSGSSPLCFEEKDDLPPEGYTMEICRSGITIGYKDAAGAFHAVSTLKQILRQCEKETGLPYLQIMDYPDFGARGIMLDISRDRIPTLETLYRIVDLMADVKLNQLQLYIEGFPYAYPSYPEVWRDRTPITPEEIKLLDQYCKTRFIDLVPNQNSFGHMTPWLIREEFNELAECPKGCMAPWGWYHPTTLNPLDPKVMAFLEQTYDDLLPAFSSSYFNVGCDETFELGQGKSKQVCEDRGQGAVYLEYLLKLHELVRQKGKKMMYWAEITSAYPELVPALPKDAIALEWGYEADMPNPAHCERLMNSGIPYYVCPGTSSWNSIAGLTDNMKANLLHAATIGKKFGAIGFLNTDWGSPNHWHHLPISYPGFIYGAAVSWDVDQNANADIAGYLDRFVFLDRHHKMGKFALELGNYYLEEKESFFDGSSIYRTLYYQQLSDTNQDLERLQLPPIEIGEYERVENYVRRLLGVLEQTDLLCDDAELIRAEYNNAIALILHGARLGQLKSASFTEVKRKQELTDMLQDLNRIMRDYEHVWLSRNRSGGMKESLIKLERLASEYREALGLEL